MNGDITLNILIIGLLILANAFFVAAEYALVRVRRTRIQTLISEGIPTAHVVKDAIDNLDQFISATQVGVTLCSLALGWRGEPFLAEIFIKAISSVSDSPSFNGAAAHGVAIGLALFGITYLHIVLGELTPKSLALRVPEKTALWLARPMRMCTALFSPFIVMLNGSSNALMRMFGVKAAHPHTLALSEEELLMLLSESKKAGVVSEDEQRMLQRVFKFHDKTVREIMIPRPDIIALDLRANEHQIQDAFKQGYSRLPVYDGTLNNVKGIVYVKDLIYTMQDPKLIKLVDLLRECIFVPESKAVNELLREFQKAKVHMAIVVDEFGDTAGLVTLEDVIEEIVGEIQDEYDYEPAQVQRTQDGTVIFDGKCDIDRFKEIFPMFEMPEGSFETVAGLVFKLAGRVPREADVLQQGEFTFRVVKRDGRRLRRIAVFRMVPAPDAEDAAEVIEAAADHAHTLEAVPLAGTPAATGETPEPEPVAPTVTESEKELTDQEAALDETEIQPPAPRENVPAPRTRPGASSRR